MTSRERTLFAASESAIGALMAIGGLLMLGSNGFLGELGIVLIFFGVIALGHAVAIGLGLLTPSYLGQPARPARTSQAKEGVTQYYCWHCYAPNVNARGPCADCGRAIEPPVDAGYVDQLVWALRHPLPGRQMIAAQILGERREPVASQPLRELVDGGDPYLAAQTLQSLVLIVGVDRVRDLLAQLERSGAPAVARVAAKALHGRG